MQSPPVAFDRSTGGNTRGSVRVAVRRGGYDRRVDAAKTFHELVGGPRVPDVHRHRARRRRAARLPRRLRHADEHRPAALRGLPLAQQPHLPPRPRRASCSASTACPSTRPSWPSCSAARRPTRSTSSPAAPGTRGPGGVPLLDECPNRFVGRVLWRHDAGDHDALPARAGRGREGHRRGRVHVPSRQAHRARARGLMERFRRLLPDAGGRPHRRRPRGRGPRPAAGRTARSCSSTSSPPPTGAPRSPAAPGRSPTAPTTSSSTRCARASTRSWWAPRPCASRATARWTRPPCSSPAAPACPPTSDCSKAPENRVIVLTPSPDAELPPCEAEVSYLRAPLEEGVRRLRTEHGIASIDCEGGPQLFGDLLRAGLVDELHLVIAAKLVAGDDPGHDPLRPGARPAARPRAALAARVGRLPVRCATRLRQADPKARGGCCAPCH